MNLNHKTGEILECFGFIAGCHPKEAKKVKEKLTEIIKEAHKEMRHACAESVNKLATFEHLRLGSQIDIAIVHGVVMNTEIED